VSLYKRTRGHDARIFQPRATRLSDCESRGPRGHSADFFTTRALARVADFSRKSFCFLFQKKPLFSLFFFEKKNQKTFACHAARAKLAAA